MAVFKKYKGKRLNPKDKDWSKGTWYVWKRLEGKIIHQSIRSARTKEQAEQAERFLIERMHNRLYGIADHHTCFADFAEGLYTRYVEQHNVNRAAKTLYIRYLTRYLGRRILAEITAQDCRDVQWKLRKQMSDSSVNRVMSTLSKIFSLACEQELIDRNPMQYVKSLKEPPPRSRLLTAEEKERLWKELEKDPLMLRLVVLAVNLPLRRGQLLKLTPDSIDTENGVAYVVGSKGREPRTVPLNTAACSTLISMRADGQLPFPLKDFRKRWWKALRNAKIDNFRFHDLRKEFASELIRKNVNPNIVQKLFAHSSLAITDVYMHSDMDALKQAVNRLDATELQPTQEIDGPPN